VLHEEAVKIAADKIPLKYCCYDESRRRAFIRTLIGDRDSGGSEAPVVIKRFYKYWCEFLRMAAKSGSPPVKILDSHESEKLNGTRCFFSAMFLVAQFRKLAITAGGYIAIVPKEQELEIPYVLFLA
jgi:hypothetical protein